MTEPLSPQQAVEGLTTIERLERLEKLLAEPTKVKVNDLPIADLQRKLEKQWQPDGSLLLIPGSVTSELAGRGVVIRPTSTTPEPTKIEFGNAAFVWPGAVGVQNIVVNHNLGVVPTAVFITQANNNVFAEYRAFTFTATQFTCNVLANVRGGYNAADNFPGAGVADNFYWLAIR